MTPRTMSPASHSAIPHASLRALRAALVRDLGDGFAAVLQESGHAGGESVFASFAAWCGEHGQGSPEAMPYAAFQQAAARFFTESGWGTVTLTSLGDAAVALDSADWSEADPEAAMPYPSCYYSAGMLSDFFGHVADDVVGCIEVECRSHGAERCRFLLTSADVVSHVYQRLTEGVGYEEALQELA